MRKNTVFCILGGDLRQAHLANLLSRRGFFVKALFFDQEVSVDREVERTEDFGKAIEESTVFIFPLPVTTNGVTLNTPFSSCKILLEDCLALLPENSIVLGGMVDDTLREKAMQKKITFLDYLKREELMVLNAIPTAEGAVALAMQELSTTVFGQQFLIAGFGRVAKALARILNAMGAKVRVAARKCEDLAWVKLYGYEAVPVSQLAEQVTDCDVIYNTVPAMLFDEKVLSNLKKDALLIDLASKPGGVDFKLAAEKQIRTIWALSLPGKVAPFTAAEIICDTVMNMLTERGILR